MTAYLIATIEVHNAADYETYKSTAPALIEKHGGRYIVRGGTRDLVEGSWPEGRIVVLEFPNWDSANAFVDDPEYQPIAAIRHANTTSHIWIVEGWEACARADGMHAYVVGQIQMKDADKYAPYAQQVPAVVDASRGTFLARGGRTRSVEGGMDLDRLVIVGFTSNADARGFYDGEAYTPLIKVRRSGSDSNIALVEGL